MDESNEYLFNGKEIKYLGKLFYDKIIFESYYPIFFSCKNENGDLFLGVCCQYDEKQEKILLTKTTPEIIIKVLSDEITLRDSFLQDKESRYSINTIKKEITCVKDDPVDWDAENSIYLPTPNEYMEVEEGEFDEEIEYYKTIVLDNIIRGKIKDGFVYIDNDVDYYCNEVNPVGGKGNPLTFNNLFIWRNYKKYAICNSDDWKFILKNKRGDLYKRSGRN